MAGLAGLALFSGAARAELAPLVLPVGDAELSLGGSAEGALFAARQPGNETQASGIARFSPVLKRTYDSGFSWSLNTTLQASDPLSRGRYDGDVLEKAYAETRLFVGTVRLGLTDGAAYGLSVTGPRAGLSLDDAQTTFFVDPATGRRASVQAELPVRGQSVDAKAPPKSLVRRVRQQRGTCPPRRAANCRKRSRKGCALFPGWRRTPVRGRRVTNL